METTAERPMIVAARQEEASDLKSRRATRAPQF